MKIRTWPDYLEEGGFPKKAAEKSFKKANMAFYLLIGRFVGGPDSLRRHIPSSHRHPRRFLASTL